MSLTQFSTFLSTEYVAQKIDESNFKIVDLREVQKYQEGHIPGSIHLRSSIFSKKNIEGYSEIPDKKLIETELQKAGINKKDQIIFVDDVFNLNCSLAVWTLHYYGVESINLIDGALAKWQQENHPMTDKMVKPAKGNIKLENSNDSVYIAKDEIMLNLQNDNYVFVDNRSEFALKMDQQGGSIPRAKHFWWMNMFEENPDYFILKDSKEIIADLKKMGITKDKTVVNYCESAPQSALVYVVMKDLGFPDVKLYLAGYNEWRLCGTFV